MSYTRRNFPLIDFCLRRFDGLFTHPPWPHVAPKSHSTSVLKRDKLYQFTLLNQFTPSSKLSRFPSLIGGFHGYTFLVGYGAILPFRLLSPPSGDVNWEVDFISWRYKLSTEVYFSGSPLKKMLNFLQLTCSMLQQNCKLYLFAYVDILAQSLQLSKFFVLQRLNLVYLCETRPTTCFKLFTTPPHNPLPFPINLILSIFHHKLTQDLKGFGFLHEDEESRFIYYFKKKKTQKGPIKKKCPTPAKKKKKKKKRKHNHSTPWSHDKTKKKKKKKRNHNHSTPWSHDKSAEEPNSEDEGNASCVLNYKGDYDGQICCLSAWLEITDDQQNSINQTANTLCIVTSTSHSLQEVVGYHAVVHTVHRLSWRGVCIEQGLWYYYIVLQCWRSESRGYTEIYASGYKGHTALVQLLIELSGLWLGKYGNTSSDHGQIVGPKVPVVRFQITMIKVVLTIIICNRLGIEVKSINKTSSLKVI
ncbi:hypothetical protein VP01_1377g3 [Puccinia sorghi]|uniref:Uncharacterized protein n=1 Tax=Puccinia sorghi TaxID=27349 RepID=A0A0L6VLH6_9BASI|nr:hypothetical protein VP01_1377g3 [Puccinia sorghi]